MSRRVSTRRRKGSPISSSCLGEGGRGRLGGRVQQVLARSESGSLLAPHLRVRLLGDGEARQELAHPLADLGDVLQLELLALQLALEALDLLAELRELHVELAVDRHLALQLEDPLVLGDDPPLLLPVELLDAALEGQVGVLDGDQQVGMEVERSQVVLEVAVACG